MRKSWFQHYPMTEIEANALVRQYESRGVNTQKSLTGDPRFYVVSAFLPQSKYTPKSNRSLINTLWG